MKIYMRKVKMCDMCEYYNCVHMVTEDGTIYRECDGIISHEPIPEDAICRDILRADEPRSGLGDEQYGTRNNLKGDGGM